MQVVLPGNSKYWIQNLVRTTILYVPYKDPERQRQAQRDHYLADKKAYLSRATIASERNRKILRDAKDKPCTDCGIQYPFYVMQFDHLGDKEFTPSNAGASSVKRVLAEIAKCEVVCANCHAECTYQRTQSREKDLNLRPEGYEPTELPNCSIPQSLSYYPLRSLSNVPTPGIEPGFYPYEEHVSASFTMSAGDRTHLVPGCYPRLSV